MPRIFSSRSLLCLIIHDWNRLRLLRGNAIKSKSNFEWSLKFVPLWWENLCFVKLRLIFPSFRFEGHREKKFSSRYFRASFVVFSTPTRVEISRFSGPLVSRVAFSRGSPFKMSSYYVKARRSHSMPTRYHNGSSVVMPSEEMGEYESQRRKSAPQRGGLYPLNSMGAYGGPPAPPPRPPPPYKGRERKPKIYSSYAIDNKCNVHNEKLEREERRLKDEGALRRRSVYEAQRRKRGVSASPSRASPQRSSLSPDVARTYSVNSYRKTSTGKYPG